MTASVLTGLDWVMIIALIGFSLTVGILVKDQAATGGMEGFFVAGRNMRWWFLGTSIVATTFASDTPLVITGWIAQYGIAGNWFWWSQVIATVAMTVFFARKWRNSGVVTDVEITELRYGGRQATLLRTVKAAISATFVNCIVLGWVFAGMAKISEPFMDWQSVMGPVFYGGFIAYYPDWLLFNTVDNTITILLLVLVTLFYSTLGGLRAVMITDLVQFVLAMSMAILVAYMAVQHVGGLDALWTQLAEQYPSTSSKGAGTASEYLTHDQITAFVPSFGEGVVGSLGIPFSAFAMTLGVLWWTNGAVDGSGYTAQRLYSARDGGEAEKGALWYAFANFTLRSWPWAIAGVAALVIYPRFEVAQLAEDVTACAQNEQYCSAEIQLCLNNRYQCPIMEFSLLYQVEEQVTVPATGEERTVVVYREDRERGYPALIRDVLPVGLMGLALASLMAAFMSTVSTHINWGASYIVNDFYHRLINPEASDRKLTWVSRVATIVIAMLAAYVATLIDNIGSMWELYGGMMAGLGLPHLMRWFWWRANAWTEIVGMVTGLSLAFVNYMAGQTVGFGPGQMSMLPASMASHPVHVICWISLSTGVASVIATLLTQPVEESRLRDFASKVHPMGFWNGHNAGFSSERGLLVSVGYWLLGTVSIYAGMFGIGYLLRLEYATGLVLLVLCLVTLLLMIRGMNGVDRHRSANS